MYVHRINSKVTDNIPQLVLCRKSFTLNKWNRINNKEIEFPPTLESLSYSQYAFLFNNPVQNTRATKIGRISASKPAKNLKNSVKQKALVRVVWWIYLDRREQPYVSLEMGNHIKKTNCFNFTIHATSLKPINKIRLTASLEVKKSKFK